MNHSEREVFQVLLKEAYLKCFNKELSSVLSETDSKFFSNEIFETTGLTIGWKSLKNYVSSFLKTTPDKPENPSIATLDTLARYVLKAPVTSEAQRKINEGHYPFWFRYKEKCNLKEEKAGTAKKPFPRKFIAYAGFTLMVILFLAFQFFRTSAPLQFAENFNSVAEDSLKANGWFVQSKDSFFWQKRNQKAGHLTLYTLKGDNWRDSTENPTIPNLLLREIPFDCFTIEAHLTEFFPFKNWQQAGILLLEDTVFQGKSLRMSLAFNDFFGGYVKPKEILIQTISSNGGITNKPEEISHYPIFNIADKQDSIALRKNLMNSSFRIEKQGSKWRFLFAGGSAKNTAFKEIVSHEFDFRPNYVGLFALRGFVADTGTTAAHFNFFSLAKEKCPQ